MISVGGGFHNLGSIPADPCFRCVREALSMLLRKNASQRRTRPAEQEPATDPGSTIPNISRHSSALSAADDDRPRLVPKPFFHLSRSQSASDALYPAASAAAISSAGTADLFTMATPRSKSTAARSTPRYPRQHALNCACAARTGHPADREHRSSGGRVLA